MFQDLHIRRNFNQKYASIIKDSAWHFTYMGPAHRIYDKITTNYDYTKITIADIEKSMSIPETWNKKDVWPLQFFKVDDRLPKYVVENKDKFKHLIYQGEIKCK